MTQNTKLIWLVHVAFLPIIIFELILMNELPLDGQYDWLQLVLENSPVLLAFAYGIGWNWVREMPLKEFAKLTLADKFHTYPIQMVSVNALAVPMIWHIARLVCYWMWDIDVAL